MVLVPGVCLAVVPWKLQHPTVVPKGCSRSLLEYLVSATHVYPANSISTWLCEGHEESRRWLATLSLLGPFTSLFRPVQPPPRLIFGAQTVFLGLLLAFQIIHLVDSVFTQERRFGIIGTGH